ncbi:MAG TPA: MFS transporter [Anaerolineaceae bacterium]|nr:MFS transporter [Anaerolineaceae bacterium]HQH87085.1 MFS transporter [Anaerolineaceae bacterium]
MRIPPAFQHRRFALLWGGLLISIAGSQMQSAALLWHLRTLSDQPIVVSGIGLARFLPIVLLSMIGGVVADRFNRRRILFITQTIMALEALTLSLLTLTGVIQVWHIYLLTGIQAAAIAFDLPARQSLVPNLVPRTDLPSAFSLQSIAFNTGAILGPMLGGVMIATTGLNTVYLFNALSFGAVLLALALMGPVEQAAAAPLPRGSRLIRWSDIREGIRFTMRQPIILGSMVLDFWATFFSSANTLLPFVAVDILHVDEVGYGWLASAQAIGAVGVGLVLSQRTRLRRQGQLLLAAVVFFGLATILFGVARSFWLVMLALMLIGAADSVSTIVRNTIRQLQTPDHLRGRMISINLAT